MSDDTKALLWLSLTMLSLVVALVAVLRLVRWPPATRLKRNVKRVGAVLLVLVAGAAIFFSSMGFLVEVLRVDLAPPRARSIGEILPATIGWGVASGMALIAKSATYAMNIAIVAMLALTAVAIGNWRRAADPPLPGAEEA